jgi:hypothetical protein
MGELEDELDKCRKRWLLAKKNNDTQLMSLWQKVGEMIKRMIEEKKTDLFSIAKEIFK